MFPAMNFALMFLMMNLLTMKANIAMSHNNAVSNHSVVSHESVCDVMAALLRAAAMKHTDEQLATLTGVPARTIKSYRIEGKEPSLSNALSIAVVLGDQAVNALLSTIRYTAQPLEKAADTSLAEITPTLLGHIATIAKALADNRIDHLEAPLVREAADGLIETATPLSSAGQQ